VKKRAAGRANTAKETAMAINIQLTTWRSTRFYYLKKNLPMISSCFSLPQLHVVDIISSLYQYLYFIKNFVTVH
jgi:hypothetical protein